MIANHCEISVYGRLTADVSFTEKIGKSGSATPQAVGVIAYPYHVAKSEYETGYIKFIAWFRVANYLHKYGTKGTQWLLIGKLRPMPLRPPRSLARSAKLRHKVIIEVRECHRNTAGASVGEHAGREDVASVGETEEQEYDF